MKVGAATVAVAVPIAMALAASAAGASAARADERVFTLAIGAAAPAEPAIFAAHKGDTIAITLRSEIAAEVHLHGYNFEARLAAGGTATWRFAARATGRYPINVHRPGAAAGHRHTPPVAYLEVRPR